MMTNKRKRLIFHKIRDAECDFCDKKYPVVTSINENTYVCHKCAVEINKHARINYRVVKAETQRLENSNE